MTQFYDSEIERTVLRFLQCPPYHVHLDSLDISHFYVEEHQKMFNTMRAYYKQYRHALSPDVFESYMAQVDMRDIERASVTLFYHELQVVPIITDQFEFFLNRLSDFKVGRDIKQLYENIGNNLSSVSPNFKNILKDFTSKVLSIGNGGLSSDVSRGFAWEDVKTRWEEYLHKEAHPNELPGMPYGIKELDDATGGIRKTHLVLFYGKTGAGKSRVLFNVAVNLARKGNWVMFISLEMSRGMLMKCIDSREALLEYYLLEHGKLIPEGKKAYFEYLKQQRVDKLPLYVVDYPQIIRPSDVAKELETFNHVHGRFPDALIIDYANLMDSDRSSAGRSEKYDYIFQDLHLLTRFYNVGGITAVQERRGQKTAGKKKEEGESDGVENIGVSNYIAPHCEVVWHLRRDAIDQIENTIQVDNDKNRYGRSAFSCPLFAAWPYNYIGDRHLRLSGELLEQ